MKCLEFDRNFWTYSKCHGHFFSVEYDGDSLVLTCSLCESGGTEIPIVPPLVDTDWRGKEVTIKYHNGRIYLMFFEKMHLGHSKVGNTMLFLPRT